MDALPLHTVGAVGIGRACVRLVVGAALCAISYIVSVAVNRNS